MFKNYISNNISPSIFINNNSNNNSNEEQHNNSNSDNVIEKKKLEIEFKEIAGAKYQQGKKFKNKPTWIVVHYTGIANASSRSCTKSYTRVKNAVSTHFFCDSKEIWRVVDEEHIAWQCGNGQVVQPKKGKDLSLKEIAEFGDVADWRYSLSANNHIKWKEDGNDFLGNSVSFGVDICTTKKNTESNSVKDEDWDFNEKAVDNAAKVVAYLSMKYDIPLSHVIRHADATGKPCLPIDKTEVFTPNGFKNLLEIKQGDEVYQFNIETKKIEKTNVISVIEPYCATICKNRDYEVTLNHRTLYENKKGCTLTKPMVELLGETVFLYRFDMNTLKFEADYLLSKEAKFYKGLVSCIEVESGYMLIKQNNTVFITGNCPRPFVSLPNDSDKTKNDLRWNNFLELCKSYIENYYI